VVHRASAAAVIDAAAAHDVEGWIIGSVGPGEGVQYA
jgi:hypothetical protein